MDIQYPLSIINHNHTDNELPKIWSINNEPEIRAYMLDYQVIFSLVTIETAKMYYGSVEGIPAKLLNMLAIHNEVCEVHYFAVADDDEVVCWYKQSDMPNEIEVFRKILLRHENISVIDKNECDAIRLAAIN